MNRLADEAAHDEARRDAGAVGDRVGDVAGQGRQEQREGRLADDEEERAEVGHQPGVEQRVVEPERLGVGQVEERVVDGDVAVGADDLVATEQEAERDQQTARGDERDHVGDAGHQDPADRGHPTTPRPPAAPPASPAVALDARRRSRVVGVAQRLGDHRVGVVDRALHARADHRLAGEPAAVAHADVDGEDHRAGAGDRVVRQRRGSPPSPGSRPARSTPARSAAASRASAAM